MENIQFVEWLQTEKNIGERASKDVISRLKRASKITNDDNPSENTLSKLLQSDEFESLSAPVKSQLKRAISLYCEYIKR